MKTKSIVLGPKINTEFKYKKFVEISHEGFQRHIWMNEGYYRLLIRDPKHNRQIHSRSCFL